MNPEVNRRQGKTASQLFWVCVFIFCLVSLVYLATKPLPPTPKLPLPPTLPQQATRKTQFFDDKVQPVIVMADKANRAAVERCLKRLRDNFEKQRRGIAPFTDDITSTWTRLGVLGQMPFDWWNEQTEVQKMITDKFEEHLFSEQTLKSGIQDAISKFREDVEANNNELLTNIQAEISKSDLPQLPVMDYKSFASEVTKSIKNYTTSSSKDNVTNLLLTELASGIGGAVASRVVVAIGTRILAMVGTSSATAGGTAAAGTAVGGGSGTVAGPVGTAVGAGVGLVVGMAVDWWMTASFKERLSVELNNMISQIEQSVIDGTEESPGLKPSLVESCDKLLDAYREALYNRIVKEPIQ